MTKSRNRLNDLIDKEVGLFIFRNELKVDDKTRAMLAMCMIAGAQLAISEMSLFINWEKEKDL